VSSGGREKQFAIDWLDRQRERLSAFDLEIWRYAAPAWTHNALGGLAAAVDPGLFVAGKTIAATLLDLLTNPDQLARCQAEFVERAGGGVGGDTWVGPLLPADFPPPVDLPWPEYVATPRGDEWCLPTPTPGAMRAL
jgi:aminobenzoyl-glutamate utilization protein B